MQNTQCNHRHRHLVVFPLFVLLVGLSFLRPHVGVPELFSSMYSTLVTTEDERFSFASGAYGVLYEGTLEQSQDALHLDGSAVIATNGMAHMALENADASLYHGAAFIRSTTESLTIAALSSPVFIEYEDQRMIVPVGMQWTSNAEGIEPLTSGFLRWMDSRTPSRIPNAFVERKLNDLSFVRVPDSPLPVPRKFLPQESDASAFMLPVSKNRLEQEKQEEILGAFRYAFEEGETDRIEYLLSQEEVRTALRTPRGVAVISFLLHDVSVSDTGITMRLLQILSEDEALWQVLSMHPETREIAWSIFAPETSVESQLSRVFLLPYAALTSEEFSTFVFDRHRADLLGIVEKVGDSTVFIEYVLKAHVPLVEKLDSLGYPQRALALSTTLEQLIDQAKETTPAMADALHTLRNLHEVDVSVLPPKQTPSEPLHASVIHDDDTEEPEPAKVLTPDQAQAIAYDLLSKAGALFSVHTAIAPLEVNEVRVSDVLFSTPHEDRTVSFTLNVVTKTVQDIEVNGQTGFPYTPTFAGFVTWVSK